MTIIQIIKQAIVTQLIFILEMKIQNEQFLAKYDHFSNSWCIHFEPLLGWEYVKVCHDLRTEKQGIHVK